MTDTDKEKVKEIRARYEKKRVIKPISFNTHEEMDLLEHANSIQDFSNWVKDKIREDMGKAKAKLRKAKAETTAEA